MKNLGKTRSTIKPEIVDVRESTVFVASDITEITVTAPETGESHTEYEYDLKQYDSKEYIQMIQEQQEATNEALQDLIMSEGE